MLVNGIFEAIGHTPLVKLNRIVCQGMADIYLKLESLNPGGSVKDRAAANVIRRAEELGLLVPNGTIIEGSSGNFGAALAMIGTARGYHVMIMIDPRISPVNRAMIQAFGARTVLVTEPDERGKFQKARAAMARKLTGEIPNSYMPYQWGNPHNPEAHYLTTGPEILADLNENIDVLVATVSSGGQVMGAGRAIKEKVPGCRIVAVDGVGSAALSGGPPGYSKIFGAGSGWAPENIIDGVIDEKYWVKDEDAFLTSRKLARLEGLLVGASSGAAALIAMQAAERLGPGRTVVAICPDGGEKYLNTVFNDAWLSESGYLLDVPMEDLYSRACSYVYQEQ